MAVADFGARGEVERNERGPATRVAQVVQSAVGDGNLSRASSVESAEGALICGRREVTYQVACAE